MAAIAFFIFLTLTLSSTIHARENQFFNRFSSKEFQPLNTNQQQPEFIPQTQESASYGLYGHQSGQLPPSSSTINNNNLPNNLPENYNPVAYTTPIHSSTQDIPDEFKDTQTYSQQQDEFTGSNNGGNMYKYEKQGFDDARFMETQEGEKQGRYNQDEEMYNSQMQGMGETKYSTSNNANTYNSEKQGMSDTRYLENGRFYYDANTENLNANANMNTRGFNSRNEYNTQGQGSFGNSYDRYNSNLNGGGGGGYYQDQEDQFNP